jgi:hypothetical protein
MILKLICVSILVFVFNIPFGYWRANVKKLSLQWVLAVHIPVPVIIALRIFVEIGFAWFTYVFLVAAFFLGQQLGAYLLKYLKIHSRQKSSCLMMDLLR